MLDAYVEAGGNFIDTADSYLASAPGNEGGESETIIGRWMAARGNRDQLVIATKVGLLRGHEGLGARNVRLCAEESLRRLQTDRIDLFYAHRDDESTPLAETLGAFDALTRDGEVRHVAASNYSASRLSEALSVASRRGLARFVALQPHYNLVERAYEDELADVCALEGLACVPYYGLAHGFLTGKYRAGGPSVHSARAQAAGRYLSDERALARLAAVEEVAAARGAPPAAVALAWLAAQPTVAAPIASARTPEQLAELLLMVGLELRQDELQRLSDA